MTDSQRHNRAGLAALASSDHAGAATAFRAAIALDANAPPLWLNLAKAHRLARDDDAEAHALHAALVIDQRNLTALVRLAELHERRGDTANAAERWRQVIALAGDLGKGSGDLAAILAHARAYVAQGHRVLAAALDAALDPIIASADLRSQRRFQACLDHALGRRAIYAHAPEGLLYPFLPADEFFDRDALPWLATLEAAAPAIRAEALALRSRDAGAFVPYVQQPPGTPANKWSALDNRTDWATLYLWRYGERVDAMCDACPATSAALAAMPLARIPGRGPTVFLSVLAPRTRIPPHTGVTNVRAIVHLPLLVPARCSFRVGGETRNWEAGRAFAFDDTIEHEAVNDSDEERIVLICDVWNPHISIVERELIAQFYVASDASGHRPDMHDFAA